MEKEYKGTLRLNGKQYSCAVINGVRYVNGIPAHEFIEKLSPVEIADLQFIGRMAGQDAMRGEMPDPALKKYNQIADELYKKRNN